MNLKVVVEFLETGTYKDGLWSTSFKATKGQLHALSPDYAAHLISTTKATFHNVIEAKPTFF
ncbi:MULTISPECIES: hypothetical protein [Photobacterium]|uniref:hypothetical protein n=1 Tax=Photobacterium TaxID=657 RepID=UPI000B1665DB|nr:hypothetical protein [Photobacterium ganghwense]